MLELESYMGIQPIINYSERCEKMGHKQQMAYSPHEKAFTQICFSCEKVRTNLPAPETK
jgi:hypothetical protein